MCNFLQFLYLKIMIINWEIGNKVFPFTFSFSFSLMYNWKVNFCSGLLVLDIAVSLVLS